MMPLLVESESVEEDEETVPRRVESEGEEEEVEEPADSVKEKEG